MHYFPCWLDTKRMLSGCGLAIALLLLATSSQQTPPEACYCSALRVNCSSLGLTEAPWLPADTAELHLQDNQLTAVPPGYFDRLDGLRRVALSGNPFHCDCGIQYLRAWLQRNRDAVSGATPTCASPNAVAHAAVAALSDAHFSSCGRRRCADGVYSGVMAAMVCGLVGLLLWSLRLAKRSTFTLDINKRHAGLEAASLRSLKPKHRNSAGLAWTVELERPLINMELLPQVMDILHKKHTEKMKAA